MTVTFLPHQQAPASLPASPEPEHHSDPSLSPLPPEFGPIDVHSSMPGWDEAAVRDELLRLLGIRIAPEPGGGW
ncbi:hypothetical protein [Streptomyces sp. MP131-18]|uniref:hypothetical protein n=1 Tax=Streptomyces sp. MP131-18 TaxID=1857892 RepID=UPI00097C6CAC|nr:hypothetical protein [Streptomyces sp. MP131-18]ONK13288.1 hypothetical protein STBA_40510 [Streptomyces sp. MP131-18]